MSSGGVNGHSRRISSQRQIFIHFSAELWLLQLKLPYIFVLPEANLWASVKIVRRSLFKVILVLVFHASTSLQNPFVPKCKIFDSFVCLFVCLFVCFDLNFTTDFWWIWCSQRSYNVINWSKLQRWNNLVIADSNPKFEKRHKHIYGTFCRLRLDCQRFRKNQGEKSVNFWNKLSRLYRIAIFTHALMTIQVVVNTYLRY